MKAQTGIIVSVGMKNTVVIEREITTKHALYKKIIKRNRRIKAHNELPLVVGDIVSYTQTRPISKEKHYKVLEKITK